MTRPRATWTLWQFFRNGGWEKRITVVPERFESGKDFLKRFVESNIARFPNGYWCNPKHYQILPAGRKPK